MGQLLAIEKAWDCKLLRSQTLTLCNSSFRSVSTHASQRPSGLKQMFAERCSVSLPNRSKEIVLVVTWFPAAGTMRQSVKPCLPAAAKYSPFGLKAVDVT